MKKKKILVSLLCIGAVLGVASCKTPEVTPTPETPPVTETPVTPTPTPAVVKYTVTFNSNGGSAINSVEVEENKKVTAPAAPTKEGYNFVGWFSDEALTKDWSFDTAITANTTLYAKWEAVVVEQKYNVVYDINDLGTQPAVLENVAALPAKLPVLTAEGYNFLGWYIDEACTVKAVAGSAIIANTVLYAKWEKIKTSVLYNNISKDEVYYSSAYNLSGNELKTELHKIVEKTHTKKLTYSEVWGALKKADKGEGDNVICIYTGVLHAFNKQDTGSSGNDIWNREHVWPNSKGFGNKSHTAYSDIHHLYASNKNINATRGNKDFGDFELLGISSSSKDNYGNKWNSTYFEPRDEVKGDLARALFYMVIRYDGDVCNNCNLDLELVLGASTSLSNTYDKIGKLGDLASLIKWHYEDPVSEAELARNEIVYGIQGNRNPFIDHPEIIGALYYEYAKAYLN